MGHLRTARNFYLEELRPYLTNSRKKPLKTQAFEMVHLFREYRYVPYQYIKTVLYHQSFSGSVGDYIPPKLVSAYLSSINKEEHYEITRNKVQLRRILDQAGVATVRELFSVGGNGIISDYKGHQIDAEQARRIVVEHDDAVFVKPLRGTWGTGAHILGRGEVPADFPNGRKDLVVQPVIRQHPTLTVLYPHAINTVRIDTLRTESGIINNAAVLRMGSGGAVVDNGSAGGLIAGLDLETGRLRPVARQKAKYNPDAYERHPDTGVRFADVTVPFWSEIRELAKRAAELLPFGSLGWDIAVTPEGPLIIEANSNWEVTVMQIGWGGLGSTELGRRVRRFHGLPVRGDEGSPAPAAATSRAGS